MRAHSIGGLDVLEIPSDDPVALTCVVMHGYGADMNDLAALGPVIPAQRAVRWIFPNAPLALDWGGRAWFPIDVQAFEEAQRSGKPRDLSLREPEGMAQSRARLQELLRALNVPPEKLVVLGFSQGAMMAVDAALRAEQAPAGVGVLSGTLVDRKTMRELAPQKKGLAFFQSHGSVDPILGFAQALELERELVQAGWKGKMLRFEGGHGVPPEAIAALGAWMRTL